MTGFHVIFLFLTFIFITVFRYFYNLHYSHAPPRTHAPPQVLKYSFLKPIDDRNEKLPKMPIPSLYIKKKNVVVFT